MLFSSHSFLCQGSHDSFTFYLDSTSPVAPGSPDTVRNLVSMFGDVAKKIVHSWSVTQSLNFEEQLNMGIRYFDFRVSCWPGKEGFFFVHGLYGLGVCESLRKMNVWLDDHPKEMVFLDFNHLYSLEGKHQELVTCIEETFASKLCPEMDLEAASLSVLRDVGWQVVVFYHHQATALGNPQLWPASSVHSVWPNTTQPRQMVDILNAHHTRGRPPNKFYVSQGVLTPTGTTILQHISNDLKEIFAVPAMRNTKFFLQDKASGPKGINIVLADFVETEQFVDAVLALNQKQ